MTEETKTILINRPIGAPNSPARWLQENIGTIPDDHKYALMQCLSGNTSMVTSGTKKHCKELLTDDTKQVVCELDKYR